MPWSMERSTAKEGLNFSRRLQELALIDHYWKRVQTGVLLVSAYFDFIGKLLNDSVLLAEVELYRLQMSF